MKKESINHIVLKKISKALTAVIPVFICLLFLSNTYAVGSEYIDDLGRSVKISGKPRHVVSLAPGATECLCALDIGKALVGITTSDSYFPCLVGVPAVGPPESPDWDRVRALKPDLLIVNSADFEKFRALLGKTPTIAWNDAVIPSTAEEKIIRLGTLFGKNKEAKAAVDESKDFRDTIALKLAKIAPDRRLRVMRLTGMPGGVLGTPGKDSYESTIIQEAGGIAPELSGDTTIELSPKDFQEFNPNFIYACEEDAETILSYSKKSPWSRNKAIKDVHYYPCQLTNRASAHVGYFVAWLSSDMYPDDYGDSANFVTTSEITKRTPVPIKNIPYLKDANILEYKLFDFPHRTLLINFKSPQNVVSTGDDAPWDSVDHVGNSGSPPMAWGIHHKEGWETASNSVYKALGVDKDKTSLIFTGADLRALSVKSASYKDMHITALVTAGVDGNAIRTSKDKGNWYQPGTINIILLSSRALSHTGAASAIIVITEAKTAALWDMDIRSAETPKENPATGTGTDDIIVVMGGHSAPLDYTGGHSKIGELIARVVYDAVTEAILLQNGKGKVRPIWQRLSERGIIINQLGPDFKNQGASGNFEDKFYKLLLEPRAQALLEAALALDDAYVMGEYSEISTFQDFALNEASKIASQNISQLRNLVKDESIPPALKSALNALGTALLVRKGL